MIGIRLNRIFYREFNSEIELPTHLFDEKTILS